MLKAWVKLRLMGSLRGNSIFLLFYLTVLSGVVYAQTRPTVVHRPMSTLHTARGILPRGAANSYCDFNHCTSTCNQSSRLDRILQNIVGLQPLLQEKISYCHNRCGMLSTGACRDHRREQWIVVPVWFDLSIAQRGGSLPQEIAQDFRVFLAQRPWRRAQCHQMMEVENHHPAQFSEGSGERAGARSRSDRSVVCDDVVGLERELLGLPSLVPELIDRELLRSLDIATQVSPLSESSNVIVIGPPPDLIRKLRLMRWMRFFGKFELGRLLGVLETREQRRLMGVSLTNGEGAVIMVDGARPTRNSVWGRLATVFDSYLYAIEGFDASHQELQNTFFYNLMGFRNILQEYLDAVTMGLRYFPAQRPGQDATYRIGGFWQPMTLDDLFLWRTRLRAYLGQINRELRSAGYRYNIVR